MRKNTTTIRSLLGVTQQDMALLLKISRSQWSMYELGKRDLPLEATQLLAEMLQHVQGAKAAAKPLPKLVEQDAKKEQQLELLLKENEYQLLLTARKIGEIERKYAAKVGVLHLVDFLAQRMAKREAPEAHLLDTIANKATKSVAEFGSAALFKQQHKKELLELEKLLLESALRKMRKTSEL